MEANVHVYSTVHAICIFLKYRTLALVCKAMINGFDGFSSGFISHHISVPPIVSQTNFRDCRGGVMSYFILFVCSQ